MINPGSYYARMGIWGEPTSGPSILDNAMNTSSKLQSLQGQYYQNMIDKYKSQNAAMDTQENQQTLAGRIGAMNVKNQTDMQIYPQMQQAKLSQEQQTVNEIMSRTGLNRAQATEAAARTGLIGAQTQQVNASMNPGYSYDSIYQQYQNSPDGSPRKSYFAGILNNMMAGAPAPGASKKQSTSSVVGGVGAGTVAGGAPGANIQLNPLGGSPRAGFHQGFFYSPDNGDQTIESPTTNSATRNQTRLEAHSEIGDIYPTVMNGIKPYQGPGGSIRLIMDSYAAQKGDPDAQQRLTNYATAQRFLPELANINARQSSGQAPGIEMNREFQNSMFPGLPTSFANYFVPPSIQAQANQSYLPLQSSAVNSAINQERSGYATPGTPDFAKTPQSVGYFDAHGYNPPSQNSSTSSQVQAQGQQNPQMPSDDDIQYTAQKYGLSVDEVRRRIGVN